MYAFVDPCCIPICESGIVRDIILIDRSGQRGYKNTTGKTKGHIFLDFRYSSQGLG